MKKINNYLTIKEAAEFLGVSKNTLREWDFTGKLKAYRSPSNNYRLYTVCDLKKFLSRLQKKPK